MSVQLFLRGPELLAYITTARKMIMRLESSKALAHLLFLLPSRRQCLKLTWVKRSNCYALALLFCILTSVTLQRQRQEKRFTVTLLSPQHTLFPSRAMQVYKLPSNMEFKLLKILCGKVKTHWSNWGWRATNQERDSLLFGFWAFYLSAPRPVEGC